MKKKGLSKDLFICIKSKINIRISSDIKLLLTTRTPPALKINNTRINDANKLDLLNRTKISLIFF